LGFTLCRQRTCVKRLLKGTQPQFQILLHCIRTMLKKMYVKLQNIFWCNLRNNDLLRCYFACILPRIFPEISFK
jgi:hypothetical protein